MICIKMAHLRPENFNGYRSSLARRGHRKQRSLYPLFEMPERERERERERNEDSM